MDKKILEISDRIENDPSLNPGDKMLVFLNRERDSMLEGAYLRTKDSVRKVYCESHIDGVLADEAVIRMTEDGMDLVSFHESRPSSKTHRPNGICFPQEGLDFPCVVFYNCGKERLTVDGDWLAPGEYTAIQEVDMNSPEAQRAFEEYCKSPEALAGMEELRRACEEKKREG